MNKEYNKRGGNRANMSPFQGDGKSPPVEGVQDVTLEQVLISWTDRLTR
jgi:hypothetical protein